METHLDNTLINILKSIVPPDDVYTTLYKAICLLCCTEEGMSERCLDVQDEIDDLVARYYTEIEKAGVL